MNTLVTFSVLAKLHLGVPTNNRTVLGTNNYIYFVHEFDFHSFLIIVTSAYTENTCMFEDFMYFYQYLVISVSQSGLAGYQKEELFQSCWFTLGWSVMAASVGSQTHRPGMAGKCQENI